VRLHRIKSGERLWARTLIENMEIIRESLNTLINDHVKIGALTATQFSAEVLKWLYTFLPGYVRTDINYNMPYMASEEGIRYKENEKGDINPWPHVWIAGTTTVEFDVANKKIVFKRSGTPYKTVTSSGWV